MESHACNQYVLCSHLTEEQFSKDNVLSHLFKKDFGSFRSSVKREHVSTQFTGKKSLLHYTVASGDVKSVEHVLSLGAEVDCVMAKGYTPLIVAVLNRSVVRHVSTYCNIWGFVKE